MTNQSTVIGSAGSATRTPAGQPHHRRSQMIPRCPRLAWAVAIALAAALWLPGVASAATPAAGFTLSSLGQPTNFAPGDSTGTDTYTIVATNAGTQPTDGSQVTMSDTLPTGLSAQRVDFYWSNDASAGLPPTTDLSFLCPTATECDFPLALAPGDRLVMVIHVAVDPSASGQVTNSAAVSGGGAPTVTTTSQNTISATPAPFGIQNTRSSLTGVDGAPDTRAGGHPYEFTTTTDLNTETSSANSKGGTPIPVEDPKTITVDLPPGLIGDPQATPQCPLSAFAAGIQPDHQSLCPLDSQVGTITLSIFSNQDTSGTEPLYNLTPQPGVPAEFGFLDAASSDPVILTSGVRTGGDYGLRTMSGGIPQVGVSSVSATLWGVPADPSHDPQRGQVCVDVPQGSFFHCDGGGAASGAPAVPFLTNPTDCSASESTVGVSTDSWQNPGLAQSASAALPAVTGCDALAFNPTLAVAPDTSQAGAPMGLSVELSVPQNNNPLPFAYGNGAASPPTGLDYSPLATPELRDATVTLPEGITVNPSSGDGLQGCSDAQIALSSPDPGSCPDASKIGAVVLHTPLLDHALPGDVFLGTPQCNPCSPADAASGRMVRLFIQIDDPESGVVVKLPGSVSVDQPTGQLTATFKQNPQLPFDDLKLQFKTGPRAPLVNPSTCGTFTTTSDLAPWSAPFSGADATPSSSFDITGCGNPSTFAPSFTAGVQNPQAGAHSAFVLSFGRTDADQMFQNLSVTLPPGLTAKLAGVPLCSDSDANAGNCPADSQVGTVETGAGAGSQPLFLGGKAFLTGPYKGGPYGLAVEVPAIAGPFNLGMVVVRQAIHVDPTTAQVTVVSDPFPMQLDGIPLRLRRVDVNMDRSGFIVNPTSCNPMAITGSLSSTGGMSDAVSSRFQVGGCQDLGFSPKLKFALTGKGQTHSGQHPTLTATLTQGSGQANIQSAKVALPLSLALDTNNSNNVCNYDVAQAVHGGAVGCPANTIVGQATAVTPLLSQPLTGPVYLVQGIRFGPQGQRIHTLPSLLIPLRGQIALDLRASSSVNGAQQLVTTFSTIPDAPVSSFTLQINGGKKGILVITGRGKSICGKAQVANANFGGQSGKAENQNPKFSTPACHGVKRHRKHK